MYNVKGQRSAALTKFKSIITFPFCETIALRKSLRIILLHWLTYLSWICYLARLPEDEGLLERMISAHPYL